MCSNPLPTLKTIERMMHCLLGDQVEARNSVPGPDLTKPHVVASYVNDANEVQRILVCELGLANSMGAAMSMIPAGVANEATKSGIVAQNIESNLGEVLNICVNLFTENSTDRLTYSNLKLCTPKDPAPVVKQSVKFALDIPRYAGGALLAGSV
jgi:hypothetical protein